MKISKVTEADHKQSSVNPSSVIQLLKGSVTELAKDMNQPLPHTWKNSTFSSSTGGILPPCEKLSNFVGLDLGFGLGFFFPCVCFFSSCFLFCYGVFFVCFVVWFGFFGLDLR